MYIIATLPQGVLVSSANGYQLRTPGHTYQLTDEQTLDILDRVQCSAIGSLEPELTIYSDRIEVTGTATV